ncbi:MAG: phenylalanine--tRNA ligase subunit alpha [bacterium]
MQNKLNKLRQEISDQLSSVRDLSALRELEVKYFGRKGELTQILRSIKELKEEEKKEIGQLANEIKSDLALKFKEAENLIEKSGQQSSFTDVTLPGEKIVAGHLHPITKLQNELEDLFSDMGFMVLDGPELESDYFCFEALNIPPNHPARDMQDTFYIDAKNKSGQCDMVMRPHTSPVQVRAMQKYGAPLRCVSPGRTFRCEATDACHEHTFYQMEGLMIDEDVSIANMISVMKELINKIFKKEMETRIRPGFFPFVEPAIEMDIKCTICNGAKCPACKHSGWLEIFPAGMVHPNVLKYGGIDSKKYSGFAFGLGLTRLAMMKYGVEDIRLFNSGDLRFFI